MANTPNIKPLGDRVLVQAVEETEKVEGGIIIPDSAKEKPQEATVIAVGPGKKNSDCKTCPLDVKVGDKVITSKYGGTELKYNGQNYSLVSEGDILAIVC